MKNITVSGLLKKYKTRPQKKLGQNFLTDVNLMNKLIDDLELYPDEDVLEIGAGLGVFSQRIARHALGVLAIEKDKRLLKIAQDTFEDKTNLKFIEGDFLEFNLPHLLEKLRLPIKVIGNVPYYISSQILFKLLDHSHLFDFAVLTLQKEVAQRLVGKPGTKDYGILTILVNSQATCETLFDIEAGSFFPPPEVTSTAVKITFAKVPLFNIRNFPFFKKLVKQAFSQRRKTIQNSLKILIKNNKIDPWAACKIDPQVRPEQIPIESYVALANFLSPLI